MTASCERDSDVAEFIPPTPQKIVEIFAGIKRGGAVRLGDGPDEQVARRCASEGTGCLRRKNIFSDSRYSPDRRPRPVSREASCGNVVDILSRENNRRLCGLPGGARSPAKPVSPLALSLVTGNLSGNSAKVADGRMMSS
jgi:hypothetical protein